MATESSAQRLQPKDAAASTDSTGASVARAPRPGNRRPAPRTAPSSACDTTRADDAVAGEQLGRLDADRHLAARADQDHVGVLAARDEHVGALGHVGGPLGRARRGRACSGGTGSSAVGPSLSTAMRKAWAVSLASAGRMTRSSGMARSDASCSIGWWVGPSSPRPTESWVQE